MKERSIEGVWWLATDPETQFEGRLSTFVEEPFVLELKGSVVDPQRMWTAGKLGIVHGESDRGEPITILGAFYSGGEIRSPGRPVHRVAGSSVLIGAHFDEEPLLEYATCELSYLPDWVGMLALEERHHRRGTTLRIKRPRLPKARLGRDRVSVSIGWDTQGDMIRERGYRVQPGFLVEFARPTVMSAALRDWLSPLTDLVTLGVDRPAVATEFRLMPANARERPHQSVDVIFPVHVPTQRSARPPHPRVDQLFSYDQVQPMWRTFIPAWLRLRRTLREPCDLYFATRYRQSYLTTRFLLLAQALEVWDRRTKSNEVMDPTKFEARVAEVLSAIETPKVRRWAEGRMRHWNEPTMVERMTRLVADVREVMSPILDDMEAFPQLVADTRHYLTHHDPAMKERSAHDARLFRTCQRMEFLMQAQLLSALGFTTAQIRDAASVADVGQLLDEIRRFADDPLRRAADQLWRVSRVVGRKYHLIRIATWALGAGAAVMLAAGVAEAWGQCPPS